MSKASAFTRSASVLVILVSLGVLLGYAVHSPRPITLLPGLQGMSPVTAMGLALLGASFLLESYDKPENAKRLGLAALAVGALMLSLLLVEGRDALSPALATNVFALDPKTTAVGRVSAAAAACLFLLGAATVTRSHPRLANGLAGLSMLVSGSATIGYAYGVRDLYAVPIFNTLALHTALATLVLSVVCIMSRPTVGWAAVIVSDKPGGAATRRQLAFVLVPPVLGGLLLHFAEAHYLGVAAAMAFLVVLTIAPLALLVVRDGEVLNRLEDEQAARAELLSSQSAELSRRLMLQARDLERESGERAKAEAAMFRAQRIEAVGQLTGGIAHDFNNLLMAVGGNLQLLATKLPSDHPARRHCDNARSAIDKGASLTSQLLAFSRTQKLDIRAVELDPVLRNARDLLGNAMGPSITVELKLTADKCWAATDPDQLELAILNLALNARDAMPEGGALTIVSEACSTSLDVEGDEARYLSIKVSDTGAGMSSEVADQAVEPFFTTKERGKGTGLGLAQVYGFVRQCGGDFRIISAVGAGTTVQLLLRCAAPAEDTTLKTGPSSTAAIPSGDGAAVLVIDDDDSVRGVIADTLRAAGFQVLQARNGEEGLNQLVTAPLAAAIIDFVMPGMNGAEVARRIKSTLPALPIIFVSGYFDTVALDGISGATILRKPFDLEGLNRAVSAVLR